MTNSIDTNLPTRLAAIVVALRSPTPDAALAPLLEGPRTGRTVTLDADELAELLTAAAAPAADSGFWSDLWLDLEADQAAHERCDNGAGLARTARRAISEGQRLARERDLWRALCVRQRDALRSAYEEGGRSGRGAARREGSAWPGWCIDDGAEVSVEPGAGGVFPQWIVRVGDLRVFVDADTSDDARDLALEFLAEVGCQA